MALAVVVYVAGVTEFLIMLYACHQSPYGVRCTWPTLWRQLTYRRPELPRASIWRAP